MRPEHWFKNSFLFVALLFSQNLFHPAVLLVSLAAFLIFCLLSSGIYLLNDLWDRQSDRNHPWKSGRPLAAGLLSPRTAAAAMLALLSVSLAAALLINGAFAAVTSAYLAVQIAYSALLKRIVILDVFSIAAGFFCRVAAGALAIQVPISSWLLICSIFLSLFLGLGKRRHELVLLGGEAGNHRPVLQEYNLRLLDQMMSVVTAGTVVSYSLYTLSPETAEKFGTGNLWWTIPMVLYGIFRYLYLIYQKEGGGNPEGMVVADKPLLISIALYVAVVGALLYS